MADDRPQRIHAARESIPTAQSGVHLFGQLRRQGFAEPDLRRVRAAYGSAMVLFAGRMHSSGKPYLAHCAGAASALAGIGAPVDLAVAGLVHGAYLWGDFGPWRVLMPLKRRRLRRDLGVRVEEYVHSFFTLPWNLEAVIDLSGRLHALDPIERGAVLMRLASELDNTRDRSLLHCSDAVRRQDVMRRKGPILIGMARDLGFPALSLALAAAVRDTVDAEVPADRRWNSAASALFPPLSSTRKLEATLTQALADQLRRARRWSKP